MIAWLLRLLMPACAATGSQGLPVPDPVDIAQLAVPARRNAALLGPADYQPPPTLTAMPHGVSAELLYEAIVRVALAQPRTYLAAAYPTRLQAHFVARSEKLNFPPWIPSTTTAQTSVFEREDSTASKSFNGKVSTSKPFVMSA